MIRSAGPRRAALQRLTVPFLVALSAAAILIGKADEVAVERLRISLSDALVPAFAALSRPLAAAGALAGRAEDILAAYRENARLRAQSRRLRRWRRAALDLAAENARLRALLRLAPPPAASFVSARVVAVADGSFARSVMIDAGREEGVAPDQAAITGDGLVGRVSEVGHRAAWILLLTDRHSRVPVTIGEAGRRAILAGDDSARPALQYLSPAAAPRIGDRVVTSGEGGVFPPGLPVGVVASLAGGPPRVALDAAPSRLAYLRIVDYGLAGGLPGKAAAAPGSAR